MLKAAHAGISLFLSVALVAGVVAPAHAQGGSELSMYSGAQGASDTRVAGVDEAGTPFDFVASWEGRSHQMLIYYGMRFMRWQDSGWGYGIEITHAKVWATRETLISSGFNVLQFTDGNNVGTINLARRAVLASRWKAHAGVGLGIVVPHLAVRTPGGAVTNEYQLTGPAGRWFGGVTYSFAESVSVFSEYAGMYTAHRADLTGGGTLDADVVTHAINVGVTFSL